MDPLSFNELDNLLQIMRKMQEVASNEDWQELSRLDSERRALLQFDPKWKLSIVNNDRDVENSDGQNPELKYDKVQASKYAALTDEIRTLDKSIIATVQTARQKLLSKNRDLSAQQKAKKLYAQTSSMY